ncbi:MAG TPA: 3-isopropylmalate dehydratase [Candidatus Kapabacteria bacterium]|nr:3-isopropylmalate dehydratase [Candidatus Kapabacteria bacterium]HOQ49453.1 3-isopropylmalate dehydratase [Candidatus Kapabacteria bacterium]HPU23002.1 3-isopropylmalate dehydratase [Candidatus Kapabacteria bacterium]
MAKVIYKFGDDISTDIIYPGRYMATVLPTETPQFAFDDIKELNKLLNSEKTEETRIIVAGKNFGCGSSREQAASCLKGHNLTIVARDFARIFLQNSINLGLRTVICPEIEAEVGDELEIAGDKVENKTQGKEFAVVPLPKARQAIVDAGGLIPYTQKILKQRMGIE